MELRATTVEDLPALHQVFLASIGGLFSSHGFEPPTPPLEFFATHQRHILATGTGVVAEDGSGILGFGSSWSRGDDWFLASLFVLPAAQAGGVGRRLLDAVWGDEQFRRRTLTDAIQPISNALYGRRGMIPVTPVLSFSGPASSGGTTLAAEDLGAERQLGPIDAAAYGFDRAVDHAYWQTLARLTTWTHGAETVAYSYVWPNGGIGPVAGLDAQSAAAALEGELGRATGPVTVRIPGSSRALVAVALRHGMKLSPTPGLLLLSDGVQPPDSLAIGSYSLF